MLSLYNSSGSPFPFKVALDPIATGSAINRSARFMTSSAPSQAGDQPAIGARKSPSCSSQLQQ